MKLFHLVMWRMSAILVVILTCWAVLFYLAVMEEVNDEVDDSLSDYAESLIIRSLSGEEMPDTSNGSNNQYFLYDVSAEYAASYPKISYRDEMVYITAKGETEPARILMTISKRMTGIIWSWWFTRQPSRSTTFSGPFWDGLSFCMFFCC